MDAISMYHDYSYGIFHILFFRVFCKNMSHVIMFCTQVFSLGTKNYVRKDQIREIHRTFERKLLYI